MASTAGFTICCCCCCCWPMRSLPAWLRCCSEWLKTGGKCKPDGADPGAVRAGSLQLEGNLRGSGGGILDDRLSKAEHGKPASTRSEGWVIKNAHQTNTMPDNSDSMCWLRGIEALREADTVGFENFRITEQITPAKWLGGLRNFKRHGLVPDFSSLGSLRHLCSNRHTWQR